MWIMKGQGTAWIAICYLRVILYVCPRATQVKHNLDYLEPACLDFPWTKIIKKKSPLILFVP